MKRLALSAFALIFCVALASAVDFGGEFTMTNLGFPWNMVAATDPSVVSYSPLNFLYGGGATVNQSLMNNLSLATTWSLDSIQRSKLVAMVRYDAGVLQIGFGPVFGAFNSASSPLEAGISSMVKVEIPGLAFIGFKNDSSLGTTLGAVGENSQGFNEISVGWYVKNAICTASMTTRSFQLRQSADLVITDSMADYAFNVDIFKKNVPYNLNIALGYRTMSKEFLSTAGSVKDSLGIVILGTKIVFHPASFLDLTFGLDSGVYTFGFDNLQGKGPDMDNSYMFRGSLGFMVKTDKISLPPKSAEVEYFEADPNPPAEAETKDSKIDETAGTQTE